MRSLKENTLSTRIKSSCMSTQEKNMVVVDNSLKYF